MRKRTENVAFSVRQNKRKVGANNFCQELLVREESTEKLWKMSSEVCGHLRKWPVKFVCGNTNKHREKNLRLDSNFPGLYKCLAEHWLSIKQCVSVAVLDDVEVLYTFLNNLCENFLVPPGRLAMLSTFLLDPLTPKIWLLILPSSCYTFPF